MPSHPERQRAKKRKNVGRAPATRAGKRQDTVAGRATKRRNVARTPVTRLVVQTDQLGRRTTRRRKR